MTKTVYSDIHVSGKKTKSKECYESLEKKAGD